MPRRPDIERVLSDREREVLEGWTQETGIPWHHVPGLVAYLETLGIGRHATREQRVRRVSAARALEEALRALGVKKATHKKRRQLWR